MHVKPIDKLKIAVLNKEIHHREKSGSEKKRMKLSLDVDFDSLEGYLEFLLCSSD